MTLREFDALARRHKEAEQRLTLRAGTIAAIIANVNRDPKRRSRPYAPGDFFPSLKRDKSPEDLLAVAETITAAFGGVDKRKGAPL